MSTLLARHAEVLVTMDGERRELRDGGLFARDGVIEQVGSTADLPTTADEILDLRGHAVLPGLINTHHHLYQTLTRAVPAAQNAILFDWLVTLYPIWARLTPEAIGVSTQIGLAELALSGCTTASDHLYVFPPGCRLDDQIEAARDVGLRFHAARGSMSLGQSKGGLPPDSVVEDEAEILRDTRRAIEAYHDPRPGSMLRVVVAPCSPFSVTGDLMRESARLARAYGVRLHTHLAETLEEERFCLERLGTRPAALMETLEWLGPDVWFAHGVHINQPEIEQFARLGCGVAHCPTSNMRLAAGIAPLQPYRSAGVHVGLGVDGSASNDASNLLAEARQAMLVARLRSQLYPATEPPPREWAPAGSQANPASPAENSGREPTATGRAAWLTARDVLELATLGGAAVLGRDDVGSLEAGKYADFFAVDLDRVDYAGALHDPVAAIVFCAPQRADVTYVHARCVVKDGQLTTLDLGPLVERHNRIAGAMLAG